MFKNTKYSLSIQRLRLDIFVCNGKKLGSLRLYPKLLISELAKGIKPSLEDNHPLKSI